MRKKPQALCIGAGAVGRGLLAPKLIDAGYMIMFVDVDEDIISRLNQMKYYPLVGRGKFRWVGPVDAVLPEEIDWSGIDYDYVFISVKSNNLPDVAKTVEAVIENNKKDPIIYIVENYNDAAEKFCNMLTSEAMVLNGIANVVVPLSPHQQQDPTFTVYDPNMELILEKMPFTPMIDTAKCVSSGDFLFEWMLKFYLHCSVHAFVAFHGVDTGLEYIHDVVTTSPYSQIVLDFMNMIARAIKKVHPEKEYEIGERVKFEFRNMADHLLMDDNARVCRDPLRKLEPDERLFGLLKFLRYTLGDDIAYTDSYNRLIGVTYMAMRSANLTVLDLVGIKGWIALDQDQRLVYEPILIDLRDYERKEIE